MNIFVLHLDAEQCAIWHNNKHVVKMILEYGMMLELAHNYDKKAWRNHPCSVWARESIENYRWLAKLALAVCKEYTYRYGRIHAKQEQIEWLLKNEPGLPDIPRTQFRLAMPEDCWCGDAVKAYHNYYNKYKQHLAKWKNRPTPDWFNCT
jgi:hypothetical protein